MSIVRKGLIVAAASAGLLAGSSQPGFTENGTRQCYYRPTIDPPTACTGCADTCLGAGYQCCDIIVG